MHAASSKWPESAGVLAFSESVLLVQERHKERLDPSAWGLDLDTTRVTDSLPLLDNHRFISDSATMEDLFRALIEIALQGNEYLKGEMRKLREAHQSGQLAPARLLGRDLCTLSERITRTARRLQVDRNAVAFLAVNSLRPYYEVAAGMVDDAFDEQRDLEGHCPVCGSLPVLATISGPTVQRHFFCYLCACRWHADRLFCPYCGCRDHGKLRYIYAVEESRYRAYLCEKCRRYLKTLVSEDDAAKEALPVLEDLTTTFLDLLAEREGFTRGVPTPWGV
jgi:FdhE protein